MTTKIPLRYKDLPKDLYVNTGATALGHSSDRYYHADRARGEKRDPDRGIR